MSQLAGLGSLLLLAFNFALFLLPGFAVALMVAMRRGWCGERALMTMLVASAGLGYAAFWAYFANRTLGRAFSACVIAAALAITVVMLTRPPARAIARSMATPIGYVAVVGACYTCLAFLYQDPWSSGAEIGNVRFFNTETPGDNQIPLIFAERIYAHAPIEPFCCGDWRSSDRPPLQAGIFLLQRPFKLFGNVRLNYQLLATELECLWICAVWVLLKSLGLSTGRIKQILAFLVFWAFLFYNSVYVWPKLLGATFALFAFAILFEAARKRRQVTSFETVLGAGSFGLAMLAHPGCILSAPALALLLLWNRNIWTARKLAMSALLIAVMIAPWMAYQKFYDPPANRLLKMHLAGVGPVDSRSTWQAIRDTYSSRSLTTIAHDKWDNFETLFGPVAAPHTLEGFRMPQGLYLAPALGVFNFAALVLIVRVLRKKPLTLFSVLSGMAALNLAVCCIVLIGPGYTITAVLSYADILLLAVSFVGFLLMLPRAIVVALFAFEVLNLFGLWVFVRPANQVQWPLLIAGLALSGGLMYHLATPAFQDVSPECPLRY